MLPLRNPITMALSSHPRPPFFSAFPSKTHRRLPPSVSITFQLPLLVLPKRNLSLLLARSIDGSASASAAGDKNLEKKEEAALATPPLDTEEKKHRDHHLHVILQTNDTSAVKSQTVQFKDPRWLGGTWDLNQFIKDGRTDWDAVIDAEARRRKWLQDNPEASSNDEPVIFDTSVIPWWAWMKSFHLPEAEKLNGRAAMVGFFMAYFIDSLTGMGVVDQLGNFFCKTLLLLAVGWVLLIRENKDMENLKKLFEETTLYDKQWQATWQDDSSEGPKK